jgi:hypothetical protein
MDPPKTRREAKKSAKEKKASVYSSKHVRQMERVRENTVSRKGPAEKWIRGTAGKDG